MDNKIKNLDRARAFKPARRFAR